MYDSPRRPRLGLIARMDTDLKILIVAGTAILTYGFLLGIPMSQARQKAAQAPRHLVNTHLESLMAGGILLALSIALVFADMASWLSNLTALILAVGVALPIVGGTLHWRQNVDDPFATKPPGFYFQAAGGIIGVLGMVILLVGVLAGL